MIGSDSHSSATFSRKDHFSKQCKSPHCREIRVPARPPNARALGLSCNDSSNKLGLCGKRKPRRNLFVVTSFRDLAMVMILVSKFVTSNVEERVNLAMNVLKVCRSTVSEQ